MQFFDRKTVLPWGCENGRKCSKVERRIVVLVPHRHLLCTLIVILLSASVETSNHSLPSSQQDSDPSGKGSSASQPGLSTVTPKVSTDSANLSTASSSRHEVASKTGWKARPTFSCNKSCSSTVGNNCS
ncbi:hypothetical protein BaRGS_00038355 [Batillaria attramentaria]|uniref:Uncharacterized protein n=1 Tax=Batillaria attramentaria TaxID=370345 RepID=A0ABD0J647_9CAEN